MSEETKQYDSNESDVKKSPRAWVPQIFYDLIARIVPGFVILSGGVVLVLADDRTPSIISVNPTSGLAWAVGIVSLVAIVSISYAAGIVMNGLRHISFLMPIELCRAGIFSTLKNALFLVWVKKAPEWLKSLDAETGLALRGDSKSRPCNSQARPSDAFWEQYDWIKKNDYSAGNRITKLKAEIHMSHVMLFGCPVLLIATFCIESTQFWIAGFRWALLIGTVGSIGSLLHFLGRIKSAVTNNYEFTKPDKEKKNEASESGGTS